MAKGDVPQCLKSSGRNIWIAPRNGQDEFAKYRPVWLQLSLSEVRIQHDRPAHSAGIIKGRTGFAIRPPWNTLMKFARFCSLGHHPNLTWVHPPNFTFTRSARHRSMLPEMTLLSSKCKSAIRRQLGPPRAWLIALDHPMTSEYVTLREGFILFSPWRQGRHYDSIRESVLVGDAKVLKQATQHISAAIVGTPTPMGGRPSNSGTRPPPPMDPSKQPYKRMAKPWKTSSWR